MIFNAPARFHGFNLSSGPPATKKGSAATSFDLSRLPHGTLPVRVEAHYRLENGGAADLTRNLVTDAFDEVTANPLKGGPPGSSEDVELLWQPTNDPAAGLRWVRDHAGNANAAPGNVSWETTPEGAETWAGSLVGANGSFLKVYYP